MDKLTRRSALASSCLLASGSGSAATGRTYRFEYWDVFTAERFRGNPLCVFPDAQGLTDEQMLMLARETNLSETTFVFRDSNEAQQGIRTRIFTPTQELPFAGHPTLGTAVALRKPGQEAMTLRFSVGPVPVTFRERTGQPVYGEMVQPEPVFAETHEPRVIAGLLGVSEGDLQPVPIQNVSTGRPNLLVLFHRLKPLQALKPNWPAITEYFASGDRQRGFYFLTTEVEDKRARFHARKLSARAEDPVTGSAAGCAIAWAVRNELVKPGEQVIIEQGSEMMRRGELYLSAQRAGEKIQDVRVGGHAVKAWEGSVTL